MPAHTSVPSSAARLRVDGISPSFGERRVLTDVSFTVPAGTRLGLIGENGSGKTTLLRVVAGSVKPDGGAVRIDMPGGYVPRIGLLHQRPPFPDSASVAETLETAVEPVRRAGDDLEVAARAMAEAPSDSRAAERAAQRYATALEAAERAGLWDLDARIEATLAGLGLAGLSRERATGSLSGGQRARLALAWLLLSRPDVLLLDEPTNHLDDAATAYLRGVLTGWSGPVLLASHHRSFLDEVATAVVDLDPRPVPHAVGTPLAGDGPGSGIGVTRFTGTYSEYLRARRDARARWVRQYRDEQAQLKRLEASVAGGRSVGHRARAPRTEGRAAKKFYADRNVPAVSRRVDDARSKLEHLRQRQVRRPPEELHFRGLTATGTGSEAPPSASEPVLVARDAGLPGRLAPTSLSVGSAQKWLVTGPNGSGKSTLLRLLAGDLAAGTGSIVRTRGIRVGLLAQDVELPDPHRRGPGRRLQLS